MGVAIHTAARAALSSQWAEAARAAVLRHTRIIPTPAPVRYAAVPRGLLDALSAAVEACDGVSDAAVAVLESVGMAVAAPDGWACK